MYDKYDYTIKSIANKRSDGKINRYHEQILGAKCTPGMMEIGYKGGLLIETFNMEDTPWRHWYYTSLVESIEANDDDELVIETLNSTYVLSKI